MANGSRDFDAGAPTGGPAARTTGAFGRERGHLLNFDVSTVIAPSRGPGDARLLPDGRVVVLHYEYPGFPLLSSRTSTVLEAGLTWEL